jgi:hypothetical protein
MRGGSVRSQFYIDAGTDEAAGHPVTGASGAPRARGPDRSALRGMTPSSASRGSTWTRPKVAKAVVSSGTPQEAKETPPTSAVSAHCTSEPRSKATPASEICGFPSRRGKCWWRLPCIHENALLRVGRLDNGRADDGSRPAGGELRASCDRRRETSRGVKAGPRVAPGASGSACLRQKQSRAFAPTMTTMFGPMAWRGSLGANLRAATGAEGLSCFRDSAGLHRAPASDRKRGVAIARAERAREQKQSCRARLDLGGCDHAVGPVAANASVAKERRGYAACGSRPTRARQPTRVCWAIDLGKHAGIVRRQGPARRSARSSIVHCRSVLTERSSNRSTCRCCCNSSPPAVRDPGRSALLQSQAEEQSRRRRSAHCRDCSKAAASR